MKVVYILAALSLLLPRAIEACPCETADMASAIATQRNVLAVSIAQEIDPPSAPDRLFRAFVPAVFKSNDFLDDESPIVVKTADSALTCGFNLEVGSSYLLFGYVQRLALDGRTFEPVLLIDSCAPQKLLSEVTVMEASLLGGNVGRIFGIPGLPDVMGVTPAPPNGISPGPPPSPSAEPPPSPSPPNASPTFGSSPVTDPPSPSSPTFGSSPVTTLEPTSSPTVSATGYPTKHPTTPYPTEYPTKSPVTPYPTVYPTKHPTTHYPTAHPTGEPTKHPTRYPTMHPTAHPSSHPTDHPVPSPVPKPTLQPVPAPVVKPTEKPQSTPVCYTDSDCGHYSYCKYGVCTDKHSKPSTPSHPAPYASPTYDDQCKYAVDCGHGEDCIDGRCHTMAAERPPTSCIYNAQCGGGDAICLGGMCHYDGYHYETDHCYYDIDCDYGYVCTSGYCEKDDRYTTGAYKDRGYDKTCRYSSECSKGDICKGGLCLPGYSAPHKEKPETTYGDGYRALYVSSQSMKPMHGYRNPTIRIPSDDGNGQVYHSVHQSSGSHAKYHGAPSVSDYQNTDGKVDGPYGSEQNTVFTNEICKRDGDCGRQQGYCGAGVCLAHGHCMSNDDCYNPSNYIGPGVRGLSELACVAGVCEQHLCVVSDCGASPCDAVGCSQYYESCVVDYCGSECSPRFFNRIGEAVCQ